MANSVEKKPVQVMISAERKRRWKREADERVEYRSLTDLVVTAVENELRDEPIVGGVDVDLEDAHDRLDTIKELMNEMEDTVDETYTLVRTDQMGGYDELKNRIQELIPLGDREDILGRAPEQPHRSASADELEAVVARTGSVSHLASLLQREGYRPVEIKGAVEQLADDVEVIETMFAQPQEQTDKRVYRVED